MLGRRSARAERGMPRGWTALCLLSLLREYPLRARGPPGWAGRVAGLLEAERVQPATPRKGTSVSTHAPSPLAAPGFGGTRAV